MKKRLQQILTVICILSLTLAIAGCAGETQTEPETNASNDVETNDADVTTETEPETITLKVFSHLPDRTTGLGYLEQTVIDMYLEANPHVNIELEALEGEAYRQKITAYLSSNELPDLFNVWGQPSFLDPITKNGYAAELNPEDYADYGFIPGSLDGFSADGKLYGLPKIMDFMVMYYNEALYEQNGLTPPTTFEEVYASVDTFKANGLSPISMDGKDGWPLAIMFQEILLKQSGDQKLIYEILKGNVKATESDALLQAAITMQELTKKEVYQDSYLSADYGAATNLFGQEKAAMYYMGSWEVGLSQSDAYSDSFRENVNVMAVPAFESGDGNVNNLLAWYGGGFAVSNTSEHKEEAIKMLNFMMQPDVWAKISWQEGIAMPAQDFSGYFTGEETKMQKQIVEILNSGTDTSGTIWIDCSTPAFKTEATNLTQQLAASLITPEDFVVEIDGLLSEQ